MKTIFKDGAYERVSNEVGDFRVAHQGWKFVPKSEWKQNARQVPTPAQIVEEEKSEETKSKKAHRRQKLGQKQRQLDSVEAVMLKRM